jgi:TspO/MBR family
MRGRPVAASHGGEGNMMKDTARQWANLVGAALALTVNVLAVSLPLNGQDTGAISDRLAAYFVPAGYVFSIWGVIYLGWIAFVVFQFLPSQKASPRLRRLGYVFALSCVFNAAWLFCWHYLQFGLSVVVMLVLLGLLVASYLRLNVGRAQVGGRIEKWCVDVPFSLYLGWITVATVANISGFLFFIEWSGFGISPEVWAVVMLGVASLLGLAMALNRRDSAYLLVLVWAFAGIAVKQSRAPLVVTAAWSAAAAVLLLALFAAARRRRLAAR